MMHVGFTGARRFDLVSQKRKAATAETIMDLCRTKSVILHHGDCLGADAWAHDLVLKYRRRYSV